MRRRYAVPAALAALAAVGESPRAEEQVRIAVALGLAAVEVSGPGLTAAALRDGAAPRPAAGDRAEVRLDGETLLLDGVPLEGAGVGFAAEGPIRYGRRLLSGEVEVRRGEGGLAVIDALPLEVYVAAVTAAEMPPAFPPEALKAQAVAARTFALARKLEAVERGQAYDLGSTVLHQVYPGMGGADPRTRAAAEATRGEVLVKERRPIEAYFHASCGGRTEHGLEALGKDLPYLASAGCDRCRAAPRWRWKLTLSAEEVAGAAGLPGRAVEARVIGRTRSGRAARLEVRAAGRTVRLGAGDFRRRAGYQRVPSLSFRIRAEGAGFLLVGQGSGHGAGLCQWGAAGRARSGEGYRGILVRYYPGAEIVKMY